MAKRIDNPADAAFRRFVRRVWRDDVAPLLRGRREGQRRRTAAIGGQVGATGGLLIDKLLGLRGRPFARFMTVMGSSLGAMLPDAWDWDWLRTRATPQQRRAVADAMQQRAEELPEADALELFGLSPDATIEELKSAWRAATRRWHPDRAANEESRREYTLRFVALQAAHERLRAAYEDGRLPVR
jgi:hypothetical protein